MDRVQLILTVKESTLENAGQGLFLEYCGEELRWNVPQKGIDLGRYAPNFESNEKTTVVFEAKTFVFE